MQLFLRTLIFLLIVVPETICDVYYFTHYARSSGITSAPRSTMRQRVWIIVAVSIIMRLFILQYVLGWAFDRERNIVASAAYAVYLFAVFSVLVDARTWKRVLRVGVGVLIISVGRNIVAVSVQYLFDGVFFSQRHLLEGEGLLYRYFIQGILLRLFDVAAIMILYNHHLAAKRKFMHIPRVAKEQIKIARIVEAMLLASCFLEYFVYLYVNTVFEVNGSQLPIGLGIILIVVTLLILISALFLISFQGYKNRDSFISNRSEIQREMSNIRGVILTRLYKAQEKTITPLLDDLCRVVSKIDDEE